MPSPNGVRPPLLAGSVWAGAGESCTGFSVKNVHLVLIQTLSAAELESFFSRSEVQVFFSVTNMLAPIAYLRYRGERSDIAVYLQHQSGRVLCMGVLRGSFTVEVFISGLIAFEVSASAGGKTLLTAEAFEL